MRRNNLNRSIAPKDRYRVGTLEKGLAVLEHIDRSERPLRIQEIVAATRIERGSIFRLLCTLENRGYVERLPDKRYRGTFRRRRTRLGYSAPLAGTPFRRDVTASIQRAATESNIELLMLDNTEDDAAANLENVQAFIDAKVDLVMEFQPIDSIAQVLAARFSSANIPVIAIETPIPGAIFFGGNNYQAGKMAGHTLAKFAAANWNGKFDRILLIESSTRSAASQARLRGALDGVRERLGSIQESRVVHVNGHAHLDTSRAAVAKVLGSVPSKARLLISALNDPSAIGALQAIQAAGREKYAAIVGQNATLEAREAICAAGYPFVASVAYFPEGYGDKLIRLALSILNREHVPLAVYTDHVVLDRTNIHDYYPRTQSSGQKMVSSE